MRNLCWMVIAGFFILGIVPAIHAGPAEQHISQRITDLQHRIDRVKEVVPPLRRAQVIRDLCVIARADGVVTDAETCILLEIANAVGVDTALVTHTSKVHLDKHAPELAPSF